MSEKPKVLVIDDERDMISSLSVRLSSVGYDVLAATDGITGLGIATHAAPNVILLDVEMRGMGGLDVLAELKRQNTTHDIPVIVLSASVDEQSRAGVAALGASCFMEKPFQSERLLAAIRHALTETGPKPSGATSARRGA
ncbi:MAG: two-component system response regulator [Phycisphaerae bacterium]